MSQPGPAEHGTVEHGSGQHGPGEHESAAGGGAGAASGPEYGVEGMIRSYPVQNALSDYDVVDVDTTRPHPARMNNYLLGGYDHYEIDRAAAERLIELMPTTRQAAHELRGFTLRAVRFMADAGVRQFLDVGSGVPTAPNVHDVAGAIASDVRVAYVDNDPIVRVHAQSRLAGIAGTVFIPADAREPSSILENAALRELFDFGQPIGMVLNGLLYYLSDLDAPGRIVAALCDALPSGSFVAATHVTNDLTPPQELADLAAIGSVMEGSSTPMTVRTEAEFRALLDGLELVEPGLVQISRWRPDLAAEAEGEPQGAGVYVWAAVGRKN
ncbi:MAG TPA: SAM-dependent methyltransferase [Actinocrinis sp.]|jgi:hypothetical protein